MKKKWTRLLLVGMAMVSLTLSACGGSSNNRTPADDSTPASITGQFIDSAVNGLRYECESGYSGFTQTGTDGTLGEFTCQVGDTVEFFVGDYSIGSATAKKYITPYDLYPGNDAAAIAAAIDVARLLMTLDSSGDPSNGITIPVALPPSLSTMTVRPGQFDSASAVAAVAALESELGKSLVSATDAQTHLVSSYEDLLATWDYHFDIGVPFYNVFFDNENNEWQIITIELTSDTAVKATFEGTPYNGTWVVIDDLEYGEILNVSVTGQDPGYYRLDGVEENRLSVCYADSLNEMVACDVEYFYFNLADAQSHGEGGSSDTDGGGSSVTDSVGFYFDSNGYEAVIVSKVVENGADFVLFESTNGIDYTPSSYVANLQEIEGSVAFVVQAVSSSYYKALTYDSNDNLIAESKPILLDPSLGRLQPETFQVYHSDNIEHTGLQGAASYLVMIEEESGDENVVVLLTINGNHLSIYDINWGEISTEFIRKPLVIGNLYGVSIVALDADGNPIGSTGSLHFEY